MSKLSYIHSSYGKPFGIAVANTTSSNVLNSSGLPNNTLIVASPINPITYEDLGMHSLILTDFNGTPVRLTYNIKTGNGLIENKDGSIALMIDNKTIKENAVGKLYANLAYFVDTNGFEISNGKLSITTATMQKTSKDNFGVFRVDGNTLVSDAGTIYVNTDRLDYSDNSSGIYGIISSESNTISVNSGVLSVNTENLTKASNSNYGIAKADGNLISSYNGTLSFTYSNIKNASNVEFGLTSVDNSTIIENNDGSISVNYSGFRKASSTSFGVVKADNVTIESKNGVIGIKNYTTLQQSILDIGEQISVLNSRISELENELENYSPEITSPTIFTFVCDGLASATLVKPIEYGEVPEKMATQKVSASFIINTNCPFKITLQYIDNVDPEISLYEINYNDVDKYPGVVGLTRTYQSTEEKDVRIKLSWLCKNYRTNKSTEYSNKTRVVLKVMYANDISINKEVKYSIVRFNSLYNEQIDYNGQNDEIIINKYKNKINKHLLDYRLKISYTGDLSNFLLLERTEDNASYYEVSNPTDIVPYYIDGNNVVPRTNSYTMIDLNNSSSVKLVRYVNGLANSEKPVTKQQITDGRILVSTYLINSENNEVPTNEAALTVDNYGNIVLLYKGGFNKITNDDTQYNIMLVDENDGITPTTLSNGVRLYKVGNEDDCISLWGSYTNNGTTVNGKIEQLISGVSINRYTDNEENSTPIPTSNLVITTYEVNYNDEEIETETQTNDIKLDLTHSEKYNMILTYTGDFDYSNQVN